MKKWRGLEDKVEKIFQQVKQNKGNKKTMDIHLNGYIL